MFHWDIRKQRIADLILKEKLEVVGFQEIRQGTNATNQLAQLQQLTHPVFRYSAFQVANYEAAPEGIQEGIGILSMHPITQARYVNLTSRSTDVDTNPRICLSALVEVPDLGPIRFFVAHLSYDRHIQCRNMVDVIRFVLSFSEPEIPKVFLGDFNAYIDFEPPISLLTGPDRDNNPCLSIINADPETRSTVNRSPIFRDIWRSLHPKESGLTFSNMPWPGLQSRPDRILVQENTCLIEQDAEVKENGKEYKKLYYWSIIAERVREFVSKQQVISFLGMQTLSLLICLPIFKKNNKRWRMMISALRWIWPVLVFLLSSLMFIPSIKLVFNYMEEEFFPSDHQIVVTSLRNNCSLLHRNN